MCIKYKLPHIYLQILIIEYSVINGISIHKIKHDEFIQQIINLYQNNILVNLYVTILKKKKIFKYTT